jgi:hypothetical protein
MVGGGYSQEFPPALGLPFWSTVAGLALDAAVVAAFALCIAALSTVSVLPLALGAAFAVAGKALGATIDYLARAPTVTRNCSPATSLIRTGSAGCCRISRASTGGSGRCISWRPAPRWFSGR